MRTGLPRWDGSTTRLQIMANPFPRPMTEPQRRTYQGVMVAALIYARDIAAIANDDSKTPEEKAQALVIVSKLMAVLHPLPVAMEDTRNWNENDFLKELKHYDDNYSDLTHFKLSDLIIQAKETIDVLPFADKEVEIITTDNKEYEGRVAAISGTQGILTLQLADGSKSNIPVVHIKKISEI